MMLDNEDFYSKIQDFSNKTRKEQLYDTYDDWDREYTLHGTLTSEDCDALIQAAVIIDSKVRDNRLTPEQGEESLKALERYRDNLQDINKRGYNERTDKWSAESSSETNAVYQSLNTLQNQTSETYSSDISTQNKDHDANKEAKNNFHLKLDNRRDSEGRGYVPDSEGTGFLNRVREDKSINEKDRSLLTQTATCIDLDVQMGALTPERGEALLQSLEQHYATLSQMNSTTPTFEDTTNRTKKEAIYSELETIQSQTLSRTINDSVDYTYQETDRSQFTNNGGQITGHIPQNYQYSQPFAENRSNKNSHHSQQTELTEFEQLINFLLKLMGLPPINGNQEDTTQENTGMHHQDLGGEPSIDQIRNAINAPENQQALIKGFSNSPLAQKIASLALSTESGREMIKEGLDHLGSDVKKVAESILNDPQMAQFTSANQDAIKQIGLNILAPSHEQNASNKQATPTPTMSPAPNTAQPFAGLTEEVSKLGTAKERIENAQKILEIQEINIPSMKQ